MYLTYAQLNALFFQVGFFYEKNIVEQIHKELVQSMLHCFGHGFNVSLHSNLSRKRYP
jgi:hypothetical protein